MYKLIEMENIIVDYQEGLSLFDLQNKYYPLTPDVIKNYLILLMMNYFHID